MKRIIKNNWSWLLSGIITFSLLFIIILLRNLTPLGSNVLTVGDCFHQYIPFLSEFKNKILCGDNPYYTWNIGMGSDFLSVYSYYLSSPFNLIIFFVNKESIFAAITFTIYIRIILMAVFMGYFLCKKYNTNNLTITALSSAYALSSYVTGYFWNIIWLDSLMVFPLIILGMHKLLKENRPVLYIITLWYSIFCNYYISLIICIFLVLYFFTFEYKDIKDFIYKGIYFALYSVLAAGMSAFTILISFFNLNNQINDASDFPKNEWFGNITSILRGHFFLSTPVTVDQNMQPANIYAGTILIVCLIFYPTLSGIKVSEKIKNIVLTLFILISMNNSILNFIWHGFHTQKGIPNRFAFLYIFMLINIAYDTIINIKSDKLIKNVVPAIIAFILPLIIYIFTDYNGVVSSRTMLYMALFISLIYTALLLIKQYNDKLNKICLIVIPTLLLLELSINYICTFKESLDISSCINLFNARGSSIEKIAEDNESISNNILNEKSYDNNAKKSIKKYRAEISYNTFMRAENTYQNIPGISTFSSTVDMNLVNTMYGLGLYSTYSIINYYLNTPVSPIIDDLFGIKYIFSLTNERNESSYQIIDNNNGIITYENKDALPIGYAVSDIILTEKYDSDDCARNQNNLLADMSGTSGSFSPISLDMNLQSSVCNVEYDAINNLIHCSNPEMNAGNNLQFSINTQIPEEGTYYLELRSGNIDDIVVTKTDGTYLTHGKGIELLRLGDLSTGDELKINVKLQSYGADSVFIPVYITKYDHKKESQSIQKISEHTLEISEFSSNKLSGTITMPENNILFLTIPYNENWKIYVDGKKTEPIKVLNSFTGLDIESGIHEIKMTYIPKGLYASIIVSIISWIIFIIHIITNAIKSKKQDQDVK